MIAKLAEQITTSNPYFRIILRKVSYSCNKAVPNYIAWVSVVVLFIVPIFVKRRFNSQNL